MTQRLDIPAKNGGVLKAVHARPPGGQSPMLVVMVHDFPGSREGNHALFADIESLLAERNIHSLRFDARGGGESGGMGGDYTLDGASADLQSVLAWAEAHGYDRYIFLGEGVGATVCLINLSFNVVAQALFWPVLSPPDYARHRYDGAAPADHNAGSAYLKELRKTNLSGLLQDVVTPTLIMHGVEDKIVPVSQLDHARRHMKAKRIEITTFHDGEHGLHKLNHRKALFYHFMQFVEKYT